MSVISRVLNNLGFTEPEVFNFEPVNIIPVQKSNPGRKRRLDSNNSPKVKSRGLSPSGKPGNHNTWLESQIDHFEIEMLYDTEAYVGRATRVKTNLFLKEGFDFISKNDKRSKYIKKRISQIEWATDSSFSILLKDTARDLFVHFNSYWLKVRDIEASGGKVRQEGKKTFKPVAGYFRLAPETMTPEVDEAGNIKRWKQSVDFNEKIYSIDDIVHFKMGTKAGYPLGIPSIISSIDDILALRLIEENLELLIHKHLFPIVLWTVGTEKMPADRYPDGSTEVDFWAEEIEQLPPEGSFVVPEKISADVVGMESQALRIEGYMAHYKERIFAGLDVSAIEMGAGESNSRSTARTLSLNVIDAVKAVQVTLQEQIKPVLKELLLESNFNPNTALSEENMVSLLFSEIDTESKYKKENHFTDLYTKNFLTFAEARNAIGRDPLTREEEKNGLHYWRITREESLIRAIDEPVTTPAEPEPESKAVEENNNPSNQHGKRGSPKIMDDAWMEDLRVLSKQESNTVQTCLNIVATKIETACVNHFRKFSFDADIIHSFRTALRDKLNQGFCSLDSRIPRESLSGLSLPIFIQLYRPLISRMISLCEDYTYNCVSYLNCANSKQELDIVEYIEPMNIERKLTSISYNDNLNFQKIPVYTLNKLQVHIRSI